MNILAKEKIFIFLFFILIFSCCIENFQKKEETTITTLQETTSTYETVEFTTTITTTTIVTKSKLKVHFIDVGEGDAILLEKDGLYALIDCGSNYRKIYYYLYKRNISTLEFLIVTNFRDEHLGACDTVLKNFNVKKIFENGQIYYTETYKKYASEIKAKNISTGILSKDNSLKFSDAKIEVLWPKVARPYAEMIKNSIVLRLGFGDAHFMLMSDCNFECEAQLQGNLSAEILKVAFSGDKTATSLQFLNKVNPKIAIISVGKDNIYGHPSLKTLKILEKIEVHRTDNEGTIIVETDGIDFNILTERMLKY
ncbi:MAG: hypothetical protein QW802_03350 [Candidatus Altiarchaeota archaeon]